MNTEIKDWIKRIEEIHLPRWHELPDLALYLDQVLEYVNEEIGVIFIHQGDSKDKVVTSSMINNYVKIQIMPAPIKKKYYKEHIAFIITITVLKQVSNLNDVSEGIKHLTKTLGKVKAFDAFITFLENALKASMLELEQKDNTTSIFEPVEMNLLPLKAATIAFASIMMSKYLMKKLKTT